MQTRERVLTVKVSDLEWRRAHAIADVGDEPVSRWFRRLVNAEYERRFGDAPPPAHTPRLGRPKLVK